MKRPPLLPLRTIARKGFGHDPAPAAISWNYRLAGRPGGTWPAQIEDVQRALKYIRANARRFGIDPARIATLGMSAGGHLATMAALRDDPASADGRVSAAVNLDGEHDMTMSPERVMDDFESILADVLGHAAPWSAAVPEARSALHRFLDRTLSHDGDRFYEDRYGTTSPLRDPASPRNR